MKKGYRKSPAHKSQQRILQETRVYIMHNIPLFWINKFGITDHAKQRSRDVSETTTGFAFHVFAPTLAFGWECEQLVHALYMFQNVPLEKGSGRQEWFLVFSPVVGTCFLFVSYKFDLTFDLWHYGLAYFTPFVWWDGLLWLLVFAFARMLLYLSVIALIIYLLINMKP